MKNGGLHSVGHFSSSWEHLNKIVTKLRASEIKKLWGWVSVALEIKFALKQKEIFTVRN